MPLKQLWEKSPEIVIQYNIKQIISTAGNGVLTDNSVCCEELRHYLSNVSIEKLSEHVNYCLENSFEKSGGVLQDIINELGRRLGYEVENGLYQGRSNQIGNDGLWKLADGGAIVIESKTTDTYRINLDTIAGYRQKLIEADRISDKSSILIVVGRDDTGDLEAQIRGSRHAWDARVISMDALLKLAELKIKSDEEETTEKIQSLLVPFEYTRLDNIIDVMFAAAKDVEAAANEVDEGSEDESIGESYKQDHTPRAILDETRQKALDALAKRENTVLVAHKRSHFWSADKSIRTVCPVSKRYDSGGYWYAFHPRQKDFLSESPKSFLLLGCVNSEVAYAIPYKEIEAILPYLNKTDLTRIGKPDKSYWHIHLDPLSNGSHQLLVPKQNKNLDLKPYEIRLRSIYPTKVA